MAGKEPKTRPHGGSVREFLDSVENEQRREDGFRLLEMFERITGETATMWGPAIVGFGEYMLKYPDGREMPWLMTGFSPRKQNLTLYVICGSPNQPGLLARLGKHTSSVSCLYIKRLSDVDSGVLEQIIQDSFAYTRASSDASCGVS
jgi:hypothetical protein